MEEQNRKAQDAIIEAWLDKKAQTLAGSGAWLSGKVVQSAQFDYSSYDQFFYRFLLATKRKSGVYDTIPVVVSTMVADVNDIQIGKDVSIKGEIRTHNRQGSDQRKHLDLYGLARDVRILESEQELRDAANINAVYLNGCLCRKPVYRITPMNKEITDLMVAVGTGYRVSYVPCIAWGNLARVTKGMNTGDHLRLLGRIQSRAYIKRISENQVEERTAYEISIMQLLR